VFQSRGPATAKAPVSEPGVRGMMHVSTSADRSLHAVTGVGDQLTVVGQIWLREAMKELVDEHG